MRSPTRCLIAVCAAVVLPACAMPGGGTPTPTAAPPLILYVSTTGSDTNDCLSEAAACRSVETAIRRSTPYSTIHIGAGDFSWYTSYSPLHNLTFVGAGADRTTISRADGDVFQLVYGRGYSIRDLTVAGGPSMAAHRNGIEVRGGVTLTLENCRIRGHYYGVRLFDEAAAVIRNCTFEGNYYGVSSRGDLTLSASSFSTNQIALSNSGRAEVEETAFDGNGHFDTTSLAASPTIINNPGGEMTVTRGSISNSRGFAFIVHGGAVELLGVDVHNNDGMALWHLGGRTEVSSSVFRDNGAYGIAIGGRSGVSDFGTLNVHETAVVRNGSAGVRIDGGTVNLENVTVSGNRATTSGGGGIWMYGGSLFLLNSTVAFNTGHGIDAGPNSSTGPAVVTARRSVVAVNSAEECQLDPRVTASFGTTRFACSETDTAASLGLGPLTAEYGTLVHPLQAGSPLIDAGGPVSMCPERDQRNYTRPGGATCDVGAYEVGGLPIYVYVPPVIEITAYPIRPTDTPTPFPSAVATSLPLFTFTQQANCRKGPGTAYESMGFGQVGQQVPIEGLSDPLGWYYVQLQNGARCFAAGSTGDVSGSLDGLPVIPAPPLPVTPTPTPTLAPPAAPVLSVSDQVCDASQYAVRLSWKDVEGEAGYRVYRDGALVATLGANATVYDDLSPDFNSHDYRVEAFNAAGAASSATESSEGCVY